jgi:GNAT superfamily N-acetyltransferase
LSDLQAALASAEDRDALGRLAFPHSAAGHSPALQAVGDRARGHVVLQTEVQDDHELTYITREPRDAAEMGRLYRLFLQSGFPLEISESDNHLVTVDADGQMAGGVVWRLDAAGEPHLDGVAVVPSRRGHGLARAILEDFASRLRDDGHTHLRTHYSLKDFFEHLGFATDKQRGGLVRHLG